jgi:hemerythrin-like metal-binding protein
MSVELDPLLLTGVELIDAQHRELFARVRTLLEASRTHRSREEVVRMMEYLGGYAVEHFTAEEGLMQAAGYPRLEGHRAEHLQFMKEFGILRHELKTEGPTKLFVIRVGNRVTEWLREHIYRTDLILAEWLRAHR